MKGVKGILLMAGEGERFGQDLPKQYHILGEKRVYQHALAALADPGLFEEILLVTSAERLQHVQEEVGPNHRVIAGGSTRQESSYLGLLACGSDTEIVLIHDAVRPFVTLRILKENIETAKNFGAANTCIPSRDTIVYAPNQSAITSIPQRSHYMRGQTPQTFSYPLILEAHQKTTQKNATDDCQLVLELGHEIPIVLGDEENIKITDPSDLAIAAARTSD
jgi:2-C-methyl-D-erythritol 4-phosphate cytidylyltransferase